MSSEIGKQYIILYIWRKQHCYFIIYRERLPENDLDRRFAGCGERLSTSGYVSDVDRLSSSGLSSPLHGSAFSLNSSHSSMIGDDRLETLSSVSSRDQRQDQVEISEEMINFVKNNPRVVRKWHSLAHAAGLSSRVEVIKARIRSEGRDFDEHVEEFLRDWMEMSPEKATLGGLVRLLRDLQFNDTALKLESGSYNKRR